MRGLIALVALFCSVTAHAQVEPRSLFERAGASYDAGQFGLAAAQYDSLLTAGYATPEVYFNLGNSFFRAGYIGHAIWAYRSASQLSPRDPDIETNLTVARLAAVDRIEANPPTLVQQIWRGAGDLLSLSEGARLVTILWILVWLGLAMALMWPPSRRVSLPVIKFAGTLWALAALILTVRYLETHNTKVAVVIADVTEARSAPGQDQDVVFSGHAGLECVVRGSRDSYLLVELANGRVGWVPAIDVKRVET